MHRNMNKPRHTDIFAEIAEQCKNRWAKQLIEPGPPKLPERFLKISKQDSGMLSKPFSKIDSQIKLKQELAKQRKKYEKFMRDISPELRLTNKTVFLREFNWRQQTKDDLSDFSSHTLPGKGKWQKVNIPHYGPPLGKAVTFYRTTFQLTPSALKNKAVFICFKGVDYKAEVFLNGYFLGSHEGFFAPFEFNFTSVVRAGKNTLLVKVENDAVCMGNPAITGSTADGDKLYAATGLGWDDPNIGWHHCPPGMGIYQDVCIQLRNPVHIHDVYVRPLLKEGRAEAWIEIFNCTSVASKIKIHMSVFGQNFKKTVFKNMKYSPDTANVPGLGDLEKAGGGKKLELLMGAGLNYLKIPFEIAFPRLWKPKSPWLYQLQVQLFDENTKLLDSSKQQFGMRSFEMDDKNKPFGKLFLNSHPIKLRGSNTMGHLQQCVIKGDWSQLRDDILLAKISNMNFFRLTQRPVQKEIYDYCDRLGMMVQTDLPLFACLRRNKVIEAVRQAKEMETLIRSHPCNIMVSYINEPSPNAYGKPHRNLTRPELDEFFKMANSAVKMMNPERVIKPVDGDYDPPASGLPDLHCYPGWYTGHGIDLGKLHKGYWQRTKPDWHYACGEFGVEALDSATVMRKYYPATWLPQNMNEEACWNPDSIVCAQTGRFYYMWFDTQNTLKDWIKASQEHQKWVIKLMTEAFRRDNRMESFAVHLLIDAFPSGWMKALMDVDRKPKAAYFAYRDALAPVLVSLRTDRFMFFSGEEMLTEVWVCNDTDMNMSGAKLNYYLEMNGEMIFAGKTKARIPICSSQFQGFLKAKAPKVNRRTTATFHIDLVANNGKVINDTELKFDLFPPIQPYKSKSIYTIGARNGEAAKLLRNLSLTDLCVNKIKSADLIVIDDFGGFKKREKEVIESVKNGAIVVFLKLQPGSHKIANSKIGVRICAMGSRHFVSRKTGHTIVKKNKLDDFKFWFDSDVGYVTPLLKTSFVGKAFEPILTTGEPGTNGEWHSAFAAAEKKLGKGLLRISQLDLANRVSDNPIARIFAYRILGLDPEVFM
jgi:glycosyl hydrolase family 2